ncbi:type IV pilus secretin PilQ [Myxococcota bacterium]|nr:type IV pilus secretin PilQ [Myxococcota bacterium]
MSVERIETRSVESGREVVIHTSKDPTFSVFRLSDPFRVLVDINDASLPNAIELMKLNDGVLRYVSTSNFADETASIVRVEIALEQNAEYRVRGEGASIVVKIDGAAKPSSPATTEPAMAVEPSVKLGALSKRAEKDRTVLTAKVDGQLAADAIKIEQVESPTRIVVTVAGAEIKPKFQKLDVGKLGIKRVRTGADETGVRFVLDTIEGKALPKVDVELVDGHLALVLTKIPEAPKAVAAEPVKPEKVEVAKAEPAKLEKAEPAKLEKVEPAKIEVAKAEPAKIEKAEPAKVEAVEQDDEPKLAAPAKVEPAATVTDVRFEPRDGFVRLTVVLDDEKAAIEKSKSGQVPFLRVKNAKLPETLERTLDVTEVAGEVVQSISTYRDGADTIISANVGEGTEHRHWKKGNKLMWDFRTSLANATPVSAKQDARMLSYPEQATSGYSQTAMQIPSMAPAAEKYKGRRISLDLKDAEIQNVLRLLADVSKLNIVASDDVKGRITIKLRNVPWDQALDIILRSKQLDKTRSGNIIRIAPVDVLRKEEELRIERQKARVELEPLAVRLIPVSYAVATDVKPQVGALLSPRGKVNIDTRTNVLVVEDIPDVLLKVERLVRTLDTQTPQVLIEARIVEANTNFTRQLGIQWGGSVSATQQFGTSTGLAFPNNMTIRGGADDATANVTEGVIQDSNYAVNLPAAVGAGAGGALGFVFGSAGGSALLSLRLSAAESSGKVKIISAPKIVTLDNKEAKILAGEKVPITVITANGPTTRFIDANLELGVTPHVTQDGSVLLNVNAKRNTLSDRRDLLGTPGILAREAQTEMLVRDGDTAVLGGIYQRTARDIKAYVPWIGQIPVIGWLFKTSVKSDERQELLIFISPRIVNRSQALVSVQ